MLESQYKLSRDKNVSAATGYMPGVHQIEFTVPTKQALRKTEEPVEKND